VASSYPASRPLVDLGAGNGRDAIFFARRAGRHVTALDYSLHAVGMTRRRAKRVGADLEAAPVNLYDLREVLSYGVRLSRSEHPVDLYARFTLHALDHVGRRNLLRLASMALRRGGLLFLEFRTGQDAKNPHVFGEHRRYYLGPATVVKQIESAGGRVISQEQGTGLAPFKGEDPFVCRIVAAWSDEAS
jgi:SAM-dependent methyltransferase